MAGNPTGGAGGLASPDAANQDGAAVQKASSGAESSIKGRTAPGPAGSRPPGAGSVDELKENLTVKDTAGKTSAPDTGFAAGLSLGAGGTSSAASSPGSSKVVGQLSGLGGSGGGSGRGIATGAARGFGAVAAAPAAAIGGQIMMLAVFINYLKGLAMTLAAVGANLWGLLMSLGLAAGKAVAGFVMGIGAGISGAIFGGLVSAATAGITTAAAIVTTAALVVGGIVGGFSGGVSIAQKDGLIDCGISVSNALDKVEGSDGAVDGLTLENAKTIFGVLSAWGMADANVAGIIGNWDAESAIDPTSVQGYFNSPQVMSDEKKSAASNTDNGIGLGQWTFGRNANLRTYAEGHAKDWWTLEMQLGFMLSAAEGSDADVVRDMIATPISTPGAAALHFHEKWERSADTPEMAARRAEKATKWMGMFSGWTKNQALADSILAQAGTTLGEATDARAASVRSDCVSAGGASQTIKEGGLNLEEATKLMEQYKVEGDAFLDGRYGAGGPGDCGFGKADNCVGFSTYFVNKYTSFQEYARGDGIDTAGSMAEMMGKPLTKTPTVYSVVSGPASSSAGHTFVVLGIEGDQAVIGEAACGTNHAGTRARLMPLSELTDKAWNFVDVSDLITAQPAEA